MAKPALDPWLLNADGTEDPFARVDFNVHPDDLIEDPDAVQQITPGLDPEVITTPEPAPVAAEPEPEPAPPAPAPEPEDQPEVMQFDDFTASLAKDKGQWKGVIESNFGGNPQVYWGKTKNELIFNILKAQANATKKIREQNRELKLGKGTVAPKQEPIPRPQVNELTSDDIFEIKTQLESNPDLAMETWFQKKTGLSLGELVSLAQQGKEASLELRAEAVNKDFVTRNPDYFPDAEFKNFASLVRWIAKYKLGTTVSDQNASEVFNELVATGAWTVQNLEEAFKDLSDDGLLIKAPQRTPPVSVPTEPAPAPRPDERIVRTETRPRAALGIRPTDITPTSAPEAPKAPSVEDLDSMTDDQIAALLQGVRRQRILSRRS